MGFGHNLVKRRIAAKAKTKAKTFALSEKTFHCHVLTKTTGITNARDHMFQSISNLYGAGNQKGTFGIVWVLVSPPKCFKTLLEASRGHT